MARNKIIPYDSRLRKLARELRKHGTLAEVLLWRRIRGEQIRGYEFHRQVPIDRYIVDFYCHELMLAIEIDGGSHFYKEDADKVRQDRLEGLGVQFLRFREMEVRRKIEDVLNVIDKWIEEYEQKSR